MRKARHFFFYGTLIAGSGNRHERAVHASLGVGVAGRVRGRLYAIADPLGWYPALLDGDGVVHGMVYRVVGDLDLAALDAYEGAEYRRDAVMVETERGLVEAQAYLWAGPLPEAAEEILGGDFPAFVGARDLPLFRD